MNILAFPFCIDKNEHGRTKISKNGKKFESNKTEATKSSFVEQHKPLVVSKSLRTILLQDNLLKIYPHVLSSTQLFPALKVIQLHGNPIQDQTNDNTIEIKGW